MRRLPYLLLLLASTAVGQATATPTQLPTPTAAATTALMDLSISRIYRAWDQNFLNTADRLPHVGTIYPVGVDVRNGGGAASTSATLNCTQNGVSLTGQAIGALTPGASASFTYSLAWADPQVIACSIATGQSQFTTSNDTLTVDLAGLWIGLYVEQAVYNFLSLYEQDYCAGACYGRTARTTFEDWVQGMLAKWNDRWTAGGGTYPIYLQSLYVIPDGTLPYHRTCQRPPNQMFPCTTDADCGGRTGSCTTCNNLSEHATNLPNSCDTVNKSIRGMAMGVDAFPGGTNEEVGRAAGASPLPAPFVSGSALTASMDFDYHYLRDWTHGLGYASGATDFNTALGQVAIADAEPTPVAGSTAMPHVGACAGGANVGDVCLVSGDCPASACTASALFNFPPQEPDFLNGGDSAISANIISSLEFNRGRLCSTLLSNVDSDSNTCIGRFNMTGMPHDLWIMVYDGSGAPIPATTVDFYRSIVGSDNPNLTVATKSFSVTTDSNGRAYIGSYPHVNQETVGASVAAWANTTSGGHGALAQDANVVDTNDDGIFSTADAFLQFSSPFSVSGANDSFGQLQNVNLIARTSVSGTAGYTWLYLDRLYRAAHAGHTSQVLPLWFPEINHAAFTLPDLVALPLVAENTCPSCGGPGRLVTAAVANLGKTTPSTWTTQWKVNGVLGATTFTHRALYFGDTEFLNMQLVAAVGDTVCVEVDLAGAVTEANEANNEACISL